MLCGAIHCESLLRQRQVREILTGLGPCTLPAGAAELDHAM